MRREEALGLLLVYSAVVVENAEVDNADDGVGLGAEEVVVVEVVDEDFEGEVDDEDEEGLRTMEVDANWILGIEAVVDAMARTFTAQVKPYNVTVLKMIRGRV
ncbi:hypothetical protein Syun_016983 [Stephania yunnanensis]|uniref:Uncharacterized protein n=1 Tax=Stephania yunnanensis TaxID=152371 RepID=A0AAP0P5E5_9MAGN